MAFAMSNRNTNLKTEQLEMESLFDFSGSTTQPSPATASSSKVDATPKTANQDWSAISPFDQEQRHFAGPSHDYNQYKQQVGLPAGSIANMPQQGMYDGYGSGIGDMGFDSGFGWSSGIDMDADMNMDFNSPSSAIPPMFFPPPANNNADSFIDPSSIGGQEEPTSNVGRLWPGMHSQQAQQAAMQKAAQVQAVQQRQMKLQAQQAQYRQSANNAESQGSSQASHGHSKRPSHANEPHVEESISRLLNQMRQNSNAGNVDDEDSPSDMLPQLARLKKDEEEMDEDERLLASEEGKKLSSKERRQLRNKVSARAFRSRRKGLSTPPLPLLTIC
jgi:bZIP-type transcription factor MBZ1